MMRDQTTSLCLKRMLERQPYQGASQIGDSLFQSGQIRFQLLQFAIGVEFAGSLFDQGNAVPKHLFNACCLYARHSPSRSHGVSP